MEKQGVDGVPVLGDGGEGVDLFGLVASEGVAYSIVVSMTLVP